MPRKPKNRKDLNHSGLPSLESLTVFCQIVDAIDGGCKTLGGVALKTNTPLPKLSRVLKELEKLIKAKSGRAAPLIDRSRGPTIVKVTREGRDFYKDAKFVLRHAHAIGTSGSAVGEVKIAMPNHVLVHVFSEGLSRLLEPDSKIPSFRALEGEEIDRAIAARSIDFGVDFLPKISFDKKLPRKASRRGEPVVYEPLGDRFDLVVAYASGHPLDEVSQPSLTDVLETGDPIYILDRFLFANEIQRLLNRRHETSVSSSFDAVLAWARMGKGLAIVPGYFGALNRLKWQGQLGYKVLQPGYRHIAIVYPPGGKNDLVSHAQSLAGMLEQARHQIGTSGNSDTADTAKFPTSCQDILPYRYQYHISCTKMGYDAPMWIESEIKWISNERFPEQLYGRLQIAIENSHYDLNAFLSPGLLTWMGQRSDHQDHFSTVINSVTASGEVLIGTWSGFDRSPKQQPITAALILSSKQLDAKEILQIEREDRFRVFSAATKPGPHSPP